MKITFLFASIALASGLLFTNAYTSLIDATSWGSNIPHSIGAAREYFKNVNPGNFFRVFSPANQVLALLALILFWKAGPSVRILLGSTFVLYVICDVMTFAYFYPRNDILFRDAALTDVETLTKTWRQWNSMNWVRTLILAAGVISSFIAAHRIYTVK
ncbi:MAG TPA: DUF1772 domain-containing protein [Ferruginibacter sp.]|jgi:hypothetical protein|nr:DUF1772 domain-containing protein [Ferruginibacter sp.]HMX80466.1 DUF1772 domain-containing protein [Ferruginibacter sp.]HNA00469.1 DUF1772 domain-containing protein [Ferruginibacter sp.]HNA17650.1 DUF1772 domain-containing protein [Ferruginibacter sp.]HNF42730.1 DUF1772 domain-containing protein [Ferruginibacter sp.]